MIRETPHQEQQGFITYAINANGIDYLRLAYLQALNIKATQKINRYAIIVDHDTEKLVTDEYRQVFDYVVVCNKPQTPFEAEWQVFWLTPFKETIKLESDLLFTRTIDHWWDSFRLRDVVLSHGCKNYKQQPSNVRKYRQVFDANDLPDVYNGLMYFRFSRTAQWFFQYARLVFENWTTIRDTALTTCYNDVPDTDIVYAIVTRILGEELCCVPTLDINFAHMKSGIQGWPDDKPWTEYALCEISDNMLRINNVNQLAPVHYFDKDFATNERIEYYKRQLP